MSELLKQQLLDSIALADNEVSRAWSDAGESGGASVTANSREQQTGAPPHHEVNSMFDWNEKAPLLEAKLDPKRVTQRTQSGRTLDYIEGWWDIAEANRIFGFGEWSFEIDALELLSKEMVDAYGKKQWRVCYSCAATVIVGGVRRQDVGYGQGQAKPEDLGSALESAGKEAVTDAMKRCLRTFGNPFGLALYDKSRANVGVDAPVKPGFRMDPDGYPERPDETPLPPDRRDWNAPLPPHDPETGEVEDEDHGAPMPSGTGLRAFMDIIREKAGPGATANQIAHAYAAEVVDKVAAYKPNKRGEPWLEQFAQTHEPAIVKLPEGLKITVREAFARKRAAINDPKFDPRDFEPIGMRS